MNMNEIKLLPIRNSVSNYKNHIKVGFYFFMAVQYCIEFMHQFLYLTFSLIKYIVESDRAGIEDTLQYIILVLNRRRIPCETVKYALAV